MNQGGSVLEFPRGGRRLAAFVLSELRPKGRLLTPFNVMSAIIMLASAVILVVRFAWGLGSVTNLDQEFPWGLWIGFDVVTGVAFAGGAYVITFLVYVLGQEKYHPIVRVTVLNGFLAYVFYAGALLLDLGRPWNVVNPIIGNSFGLSSVLFLVAWHFMLYMIAELIEFSPAIAEWLGLRRVRRVLGSLTIGTVIFGITLSTLHQSGLGALFLMAKPKIHPLWYSELIPVLFFVSSIFAGLSLVIFEGSITHRVFHFRVGSELRRSHETILVGLSRICAGAMFVYLFLQVLTFFHARNWRYLGEPYGAWYLVEILGFVVVPMALFLIGGPRS
ncbi:MAG: polysulfide reductase NrfD, partial [Acidobacteriota bacterium]|nr:polysulfide reductase NrfD [Acidobacteriota bacterium]